MRLTSSSAWVRGVLEMFAAEGIDVAALFEEAGLDRSALDDAAGRFDIDDVSRLWELAVARSGKATLVSRRRWPTPTASSASSATS